MIFLRKIVIFTKLQLYCCIYKYDNIWKKYANDNIRDIKSIFSPIHPSNSLHVSISTTYLIFIATKTIIQYCVSDMAVLTAETQTDGGSILYGGRSSTTTTAEFAYVQFSLSAWFCKNRQTTVQSSSFEEG